jgi:antirestriction protein ArdC
MRRQSEHWRRPRVLFAAFDFIQLPPDLAFKSPGVFVSDRHSRADHGIRDSSRMNRYLTAKFGSDAYGRKEAREGMNAAFVRSEPVARQIRHSTDSRK